MGAVSRVCNEPGCYEVIDRGSKCADHDGRPMLYDSAWRKHSRERIAEIGMCMCVAPDCHRNDVYSSVTLCGQGSDLTVDHPTDDVLCRSCHATRENARRQERA